jgi:hypothetical protein
MCAVVPGICSKATTEAPDSSTLSPYLLFIAELGAVRGFGPIEKSWADRRKSASMRKGVLRIFRP